MENYQNAFYWSTPTQSTQNPIVNPNQHNNQILQQLLTFYETTLKDLKSKIISMNNQIQSLNQQNDILQKHIQTLTRNNHKQTSFISSLQLDQQIQSTSSKSNPILAKLQSILNQNSIELNSKINYEDQLMKCKIIIHNQSLQIIKLQSQIQSFLLNNIPINHNSTNLHSKSYSNEIQLPQYSDYQQSRNNKCQDHSQIEIIKTINEQTPKKQDNLSSNYLTNLYENIDNKKTGKKECVKWNNFESMRKKLGDLLSQKDILEKKKDQLGKSVRDRQKDKEISNEVESLTQQIRQLKSDLLN